MVEPSRHRITRRPVGLNFVLGGVCVAAAGLAWVVLATPLDLGFGAPQVRIDDHPTRLVETRSYVSASSW